MGGGKPRLCPMANRLRCRSGKKENTQKKSDKVLPTGDGGEGPQGKKKGKRRKGRGPETGRTEKNVILVPRALPLTGLEKTRTH